MYFGHSNFLASAVFPFINGQWIWFTVAAFLAGALNAVAGGGSFFSFPAMLGMNIPPVQANATNTVALWPGQLTSVAAYREDIRRNLPLVWPMALAGFLGGALGAIVLLHTPQTTFMHLVPWLLLVAASLFAMTGPVSRWLEHRRVYSVPVEDEGAHIHPTLRPLNSNPGSSGAISPGSSSLRSPRHLPMFVAVAAVCFYIGYFGAGSGFLLITILSLAGFQDLNEINALKVVSTTTANGTAFVIFVVGNQVVWRYCLMAMVTSALGGYFSARFARRIPQSILRGLIFLIGFSMSAWFFFKGN